MHYPSDRTYALRLERRDDGTLAGELEHVLSGACWRFHGDAELLAALHRPLHAGDPAPPAAATR